MNFVSKSKLDLKDTLVPDIFIVEYMPKLSTNSIKIYLYLLHAYKKENENLDYNYIQDELSLTQVEMYDSINELIKYGIVSKTEEEYVLRNLKEIEIERKYTLNIERKRGKIEIEKDKKRTEAILAINQMYFNSTMPTTWITEIANIFEKYYFDEDVMIALFEICKDKINKNYINTVASNWFRAGVKTYEELEKYNKSYKEITKIETFLKKELRINRPFINDEFKLLSTWYNDFSYNVEIIKYALSKSTGKSNPLQYMHSILTSWHNKQFKTIDDVKSEDTPKQSISSKQEVKIESTKATKKSYAKRDQFKDYEQREYDLDQFYN